jgi:SAM-dependent MidA family methyltransferase
VGECFGLLLGYAIESEWEKAGRPADWLIVEQGTHDGQLALDILGGLRQRECPVLGNMSYVVIEPHPGRRDLLKKRLGGMGRVRIVPSADKIVGTCGIFLCNELIDAFPVHLVRWDGGRWQELWVKRAETKSGLGLVGREIDDPALLAEMSRLDSECFPAGYTTEINLVMRVWLQSVCGLFAKGRGNWWVIDYGHRDEDYYSPARREGTLRCYRDHRASTDFFEGLGETDITAHVNFSRLADFAKQAGLTSDPLQDQHDFLTRAATPWLLAMEEAGTTQEANARKLLRQFQTLTHPGMMGRAFKILVMGN